MSHSFENEVCVATNIQKYVYSWQRGLRLSLWMLTCPSQEYLPLRENWVAQGPGGGCSRTLTLKWLIQGKAGSNWKLFQSWSLMGEAAVPENQTENSPSELAPLMEGSAVKSRAELASILNCPLIQGCLSTSQTNNIIWRILHRLLFLLPSSLSRNCLPVWYLYIE